jgi:hypothetical protein
MKAFQPPNARASAARHQPDRQPSKRMLNFGSWAGRLHAVLGGFALYKRRLLFRGAILGLQRLINQSSQQIKIACHFS